MDGLVDGPECGVAMVGVAGVVVSFEVWKVGGRDA